eukprot:UN30435
MNQMIEKYSNEKDELNDKIQEYEVEVKSLNGKIAEIENENKRLKEIESNITSKSDNKVKELENELKKSQDKILKLRNLSKIIPLIQNHKSHVEQDIQNIRTIIDVNNISMKTLFQHVDNDLNKKLEIIRNMNKGNNVLQQKHAALERDFQELNKEHGELLQTMEKSLEEFSAVQVSLQNQNKGLRIEIEQKNLQILEREKILHIKSNDIEVKK